MSHISLFVAKLSLLCRTFSIQINTGEKDRGAGGTSDGGVASCTLMFPLPISGRSSSID